VLILLPPSESKRGRARGASTDLARVSFPELTATREQVARELARVSARPDAPAQLGVSPTLLQDIERNTRLDTAPALPAAQLYTGVLYDALDLATLDAAALRRARRWLIVVSALYGALRPGDKVAPYRLSMSVNLGGLGPLASVWREPLAEVLPAAAGRGLVVDCRSSTYAAAWAPKGGLAERWVQVKVPGATHMAKHTRGLVARQLCVAGVEARTPQALCDLLAADFKTSLAAPRRAGQPWVLETTRP
jgi:uncharacterized protein